MFSSLDVNSGYWQIEMDDEDFHMTAFVTYHGLFKYSWIPFRFRKAHATFQQAKDDIIALVKRQHALVYIPDIIIFPKAPEQHLQHIEDVLRLLRNADVTIKLKKYLLFSQTNENLGHVIAAGKLKWAQKTTEAI